MNSLGSKAQPEYASNYKHKGFDPDEAGRWFAIDLLAAPALKWKESGFQAGSAKVWKAKLFSPNEAALWSAQNFDAESAASWRAADVDLDPVEANAKRSKMTLDQYRAEKQEAARVEHARRFTDQALLSAARKMIEVNARLSRFLEEAKEITATDGQRSARGVALEKRFQLYVTTTARPVANEFRNQFGEASNRHGTYMRAFRYLQDNGLEGALQKSPY